MENKVEHMDDIAVKLNQYALEIEDVRKEIREKENLLNELCSIYEELLKPHKYNSLIGQYIVSDMDESNVVLMVTDAYIRLHPFVCGCEPDVLELHGYGSKLVKDPDTGKCDVIMSTNLCCTISQKPGESIYDTFHIISVEEFSKKMMERLDMLKPDFV